MKTYKTRDWNKIKIITYPSGIVKMMMWRLHTWLSVQRLWKDFACRENIVAFINGLTFAIDVCRFNQLDSGEVTLQTILPLTIVWCPGGKKKSFRSHTQNTVPISSCFDFVSCIRCVQGLGEDMKWEGLPALFCIFYKLVCQVISVFKLENPTSET